ncbi:hypothetical protein [Ekhidna sp.]
MLPLLSFITQTILAVAAVVATILIYKFQTNKSKKERTLEFSQRHQEINFYIQILSPVWKMYLKWKYLPSPQREEYKRAIALGWIGFESQSPNEILRNWIPDFELKDDYYSDHYLSKLNLTSQTEHEALTMYLEFWSDFWLSVQQGLIQRRLCLVLARQYQYHRQFFYELRNFIRELKQKEYPDDQLPLWITHTEELENFFDQKVLVKS